MDNGQAESEKTSDRTARRDSGRFAGTGILLELDSSTIYKNEHTSIGKQERRDDDIIVPWTR